MEGSVSRRPALIANLFVGIRSTLFLKFDLTRLVSTPWQLIWLILLDLGLFGLLDWLVALPSPRFASYSIPVHGLGITLELFGLALIAPLINAKERLLSLAVLMFAAGPPFVLVGSLISLLEPHADSKAAIEWLGIFGILYLVWAVLVVLRILAGFNGRFGWRPFAALLLFMLITEIPQMYFNDYQHMWYAGTADDAEDPWKAYRDLDVESLFYDQQTLMHATLAKLKPGTPGVTDTYFLGFAGYAREDVFRNEVKLARQIFDQQYGTAGRSLILINHLDTYRNTPLATSHNLQQALAYLGKIMNKEDVLVLFMTSHGSREHRLTVDFWPAQLNSISPEMLKGYLDASGIHWKVLLVSSCYSGGFVPPLKDDFTLIATAAASGRTSFGCGSGRKLTYFGEAFLRDQLEQGKSLDTALTQAISAIHQREVREKRKPSLPQLYIGSEFQKKLPALHCTKCAMATTK